MKNVVTALLMSKNYEVIVEEKNGVVSLFTKIPKEAKKQIQYFFPHMRDNGLFITLGKFANEKEAFKRLSEAKAGNKVCDQLHTIFRASQGFVKVAI